MNNAQRKALQKLRVLFIDIDHVLHHYNAHYARQFSVATVRSFIKLHPEKAEGYEFDELVEKAVQSYHKTGRTTAWFAETFEIDEMDLYIHHHDLMCRDDGYIENQFQNGDIPYDAELWDLLAQVKSLGIEIYALTNGTQGYGEMVLGDRGHGAAHLFDNIFGMDSVDNPYMLDKRHGAFMNDILDKVGLLKRFPNDIHEGMSDFDHSHIGLLDDTHRNLRAPRHRFNIHTTLQVNNRDWRGPSQSHLVTHDIKDLLRDIIVANAPHALDLALRA